MYRSNKIGDALIVPEDIPSLVNQHCMVIHFQSGLCDTDCARIRYAKRHLHQRIEEHSWSTVDKHFKEDNDNYVDF